MILKGFKLISLVVVVAAAVAAVLTSDDPLQAFQKRPMKPLVLAGLDGQEISTATWALQTNGPKVINLFASWCAPCIQEMPVLMKLSKHVPVYGIAMKDDPDKLKEWLKLHGNPFKDVGIDKGLTFLWDLGVSAVPTTLLLDESNKIVYLQQGGMTEQDISSRYLPMLEKVKRDAVE